MREAGPGRARAARVVYAALQVHLSDCRVACAPASRGASMASECRGEERESGGVPSTSPVTPGSNDQNSSKASQSTRQDCQPVEQAV